jgi:hypothetical protein
MLSLGLSTADQKLFERSLFSSPGYNLKVTVQILDLNHNYLLDVSDRLIDGQVNVAYLADVDRTLTLTLIDPDEVIGFDSSSPSDGALYADRMIRVVYSVYSQLLPRWVDVPIFCGPVTRVARDDAIVSVECQGKESLYREPSMAWAAKTYYKGSKVTDAIRDILGTKGGETKFDLPEWAATLPRDYSLITETPIWSLAMTLVGSGATRQMFYDGRGVLRLRLIPSTPSFTFTEEHLTSIPKLSYDMSAIRNVAMVKGGTPTGKPQITSIRHLPVADPASSTSLARNGVLRRLVEVVEDTTIMTQAAGDTRAADVLKAVGIGNTEFDFDSFPIPHLEPGDSFQLTTRDFSIQLRATQFSIPLKAGNSQSNGTLRQVSSTRARIRRTG